MDNNLLQENGKVLSTTLSLISSLLLKEPQENFLKSLKGDNIFNNWYIMPQNNVEKIKQGISNLTTELQEKDYYKTVKLDYNQLLIFGSETIGAIPWGSVYLNKTNETFTDETSEVVSHYNKFNFAVSESFVEPLDHIGIELLFIAHLLSSLANNKTSETTAEITDEITLFLNEYTLPYIFIFTKQLINNANTSFYKLIGLLLEDFMLQLIADLNLKASDRQIYYQGQ